MLIDKEDETKINLGIEQYILNIDNNLKFRDNSILKRILSVNSKKIEPKLRYRLYSMFFNPDFLSQLSTWHFKRIREFIDNDTEFFKEIDKLIEVVSFNSYHYNLLAFYRKERTNFNFEVLEKRIEEIKLK